MAYADYNYYMTESPHRGGKVLEQSDYEYYASLASDRMDYATANRIKGALLESPAVKKCCCALADVLAQYDAARDNPAAAPVVSWSNDGVSGNYDMANSDVTASALEKRVVQILQTHLLWLGILYRGVR